MGTMIIKVDRENPNKAVIQEAALQLKEGKLVVFPTETVYGLGCNGLDAEAIKRVFEAKGRPEAKPITAHIASKDGCLKLVKNIPEKASKLIEKFCPGPITIILERKEGIGEAMSAGGKTIGIRIPDHKVALMLIEEAGVPVAAPSANISGNKPPTSGEEAMEELSGKVDIILDAGKTDIGVSSTVIDMTREPPIILRKGSITKEEIESVIGSLQALPHK